MANDAWTDDVGRKSTLRTIPTVYSGVKFRSRAEARWAIVFDGLQIRWQYEVEGYKLPTYWYLPDFWLPDLRCFAEVKGVAEQWTDEAMIKASELALASNCGVLLCDELIEVRPLIPALCPSGGVIDRYDVDLCRSRDKGHLWIETDPVEEYWSPDEWADAVSHALTYFRLSRPNDPA